MVRVRSVGQVPFAPAMVTVTTGMSVERKVTAAGVLFAGLGSALSLYLFATKHTREAYTIGIASAIVGSVIGFVRVLSNSDGE